MARTTRDDIEKMIEIGIFVPTKTIELFGEVDIDFARRAIRGLTALDSVRPSEPINILLNSGGGEVVHGMAIYDCIRRCRSTVNITVVGEAESIAAWILQAADNRLALSNATIMIHVGTHGFSEDHPRNVSARYEYFKRTEERMETIVADRLDIPLLDARALMEFDTIYTAYEARERGLIDEVIE